MRSKHKEYTYHIDKLKENIDKIQAEYYDTGKAIQLDKEENELYDKFSKSLLDSEHKEINEYINFYHD